MSAYPQVHIGARESRLLASLLVAEVIRLDGEIAKASGPQRAILEELRESRGTLLAKMNALVAKFDARSAARRAGLGARP